MTKGCHEPFIFLFLSSHARYDTLYVYNMHLPWVDIALETTTIMTHRCIGEKFLMVHDNYIFYPSDQAKDNKLVKCDQTVQKLITILEKNAFANGAHIDYYDEA